MDILNPVPCEARPVREIYGLRWATAGIYSYDDGVGVFVLDRDVSGSVDCDADGVAKFVLNVDAVAPI